LGIGATGTVDVEGNKVVTFDHVSVTAVDASGLLEVGQTSAAKLLMEDGSSIGNATVKLGAAGGVGTIDVETGGAAFDNITVTAFAPADTIEVGHSVDATLILDKATIITGGTLALGSGNRSGSTTGIVDVENGGATLSGVAVTTHTKSD